MDLLLIQIIFVYTVFIYKDMYINVYVRAYVCACACVGVFVSSGFISKRIQFDLGSKED